MRSGTFSLQGSVVHLSNIFACHFGPILTLAGGSRCFNRVPRALLSIFDWATAKSKAIEPISDQFGDEKCEFDVILLLICF